MTVAALYVEKGGVYFACPGVEPWDEARDARNYAGPWPVVAHPPCAAWSKYAAVREWRTGKPRGEDGGTFAAAIEAVLTWGGVLEHPAFTLAWARYGLPRPNTKAEHWTPGICGGFSAYVEQGRYGHPVKKATWLYVHGVRLQDLPELRWGHTPDNRGGISRNQDWRGGMDKWRDATGHRLANATPPAFRDLLLSIARKAHNAGIQARP